MQFQWRMHFLFRISLKDLAMAKPKLNITSSEARSVTFLWSIKVLMTKVDEVEHALLVNTILVDKDVYAVKADTVEE